MVFLGTGVLFPPFPMGIGNFRLLRAPPLWLSFLQRKLKTSVYFLFPKAFRHPVIFFPLFYLPVFGLPHIVLPGFDLAQFCFFSSFFFFLKSCFWYSPSTPFIRPQETLPNTSLLFPPLKPLCIFRILRVPPTPTLGPPAFRAHPSPLFPFPATPIGQLHDRVNHHLFQHFFFFFSSFSLNLIVFLTVIFCLNSQDPFLSYLNLSPGPVDFFSCSSG